MSFRVLGSRVWGSVFNLGFAARPGVSDGSSVGDEGTIASVTFLPLVTPISLKILLSVVLLLSAVNPAVIAIPLAVLLFVSYFLTALRSESGNLY